MMKGLSSQCGLIGNLRKAGGNYGIGLLEGGYLVGFMLPTVAVMGSFLSY